jgi:hypothetical protein
MTFIGSVLHNKRITASWNMARSWRIVILLIPVIALLAIYAPTHSFFRNQYDDTYITYRYAVNLAQGHGLVFNVGERTDSASSFLYTLVLSACWLLHAKNLELVGGLIGVLSLGLISGLVYKLALYASSDRRAALIVAVGCCFNGFLSGWTLSGMETLPWATLVLLAIYLLVINARPAVIGLAIAAAAFTRFEGILLVIPYVMVLVRCRRWSKRSWAPLVGVLLAFAGFYILKHAYYGVWISHAYQMKKVALYYKAAPREMIHFWIYYASIPLLLSVPVLFSRRYGFVLAYLTLSLTSVALGPRSDLSRYSVHLLPIVYAFSAPLLARMIAEFRTRMRISVLVLIVAALCAQVSAGARLGWHVMTGLAGDQECRENIGQFINRNIDRSAYIASSDLGEIAYVAIDHRFVDLIALTSADVLADYREGKTSDDILRSKDVKYLADTYNPASSQDRLDSLLGQFPGIRPRSEFVTTAREPLFICKNKNGLEFVVTTIMPKSKSASARGDQLETAYRLAEHCQACEKN